MKPTILALIFLLVPLRPVLSTVTRAAQENTVVSRHQPHDEPDATEWGDCLALGKLQIVFSSENMGPPNIGVVLTDPRGRRFGFDPLTTKAWSDVPLAQGFIDCDMNDTAGHCQGTVEVCGPHSGAYALEVIGQNNSNYNVDVYALSKKVKVGSKLQTALSEAHVSRISIYRGARHLYVLQYSRNAPSSGTAILPMHASHDPDAPLHSSPERASSR